MGDVEMLVNLVVNVCGGVPDAFGRVIHEILRRLLDSYVLGIGVHSADIVMYDVLVIVKQVAERHFSHFGKLLRGIVCTQRCPMVVGTKEYRLISVLAQNGIHINRLHAVNEVFMHIDNSREHRARLVLHLVGEIILGRVGDDHTVNVHRAAKCLLVFVDCFGISFAAFSPSTVYHRAGSGSSADNDDATRGNLGFFVSTVFHLELVNMTVI